MSVDSTARPRITTVVFDYGEVISRPQPPEARAELERLAGVPAEDFWTAYWAERPRFDAGAAPAEYWERIARRVGAEWGSETAADTALKQSLWAVDVGSWLYVSPASCALLDRLAARGVRLALLSNAPHDIAGTLRRSPALASFEGLFFSCDLGVCKPDPAVYTHVLTTLGLTPEETAFVDDREENFLAAKRLGIDAHHYTGTEGLESFLTDRFGAL
ncbi:HAD family hydrolase [Allosalinactinospora lopnorensis]|uniref:HAD family hydrolase n=1 Tax=Allosalinactinospora lopnorensis TaxID=1352348 RepID=UPI0012E2A5AC|nr:HAD family phosphatase [Allosalinactinospora lopnorensis]